MRGLQFTTLHLPFSAGVNQKPDDRALAAPELARAVDVVPDELRGLQTRFPFVAMSTSIAGGGTISNARRLVANGSELCLFTKDALYSWDARLSKWVRRGTHLAIATEERPVFISTGDQIDGDRAELGNMVVFAWTENTTVYVAIQDKDTGGVFLAPTAVGGTGTRPRLVALATKILLFWHAGTDSAPGALLVLAIDPTGTDPSTISTQLVTPSSTTVLAAGTFGTYYDAVQVAATDTAIVGMRRAVTTSYELAKVTAAVGVTTSTKARTCDGPIAVAADPTGAVVQVIRANSTAIEGDRITFSSLADAATGQAIGDVTTIPATPTNQVTACYRSVQDGGAYRCYAFWSAAEATSGSTTFGLKYNYVDTAGTIGTQAVLLAQHGLASRAFDHEGRVFVHVAFAGATVTGAVAGVRAQLQNTYFLYRDDAYLCGKMAMHRGGGFAASTGRLPGVQSLGSSRFAWCGTERRIIPVGTNHLDYADRGPREISFTFDDNRARRTARLGATLYITGAEIMQFDGTELTELNFHVWPWRHFLALAATGNVEDGAYNYKATWRSDNKRGERDRSTTATVEQITMTGGPRKITVAVAQGLQPTHKTGVFCEVWRTAKAPLPDAPYYLVTAQDPNDTSNPNRALPVAAPTSLSTPVPTLNDELADATLTTLENNPENGDVLENLAPPAATIIEAYGSRLFLGGVAGDRRIWYSKLRRDGEVCAFHDQNVIDLPLGGGDLVAIAFMDGILVALCESAVYMIPGEGYDNLGQGANYGPARCISFDVGCRDADSVAVTEQGVVFQSARGKQLLTRGWTVQPFGTEVADRDSETVLAAHVDQRRHRVRFLTASRLLVFDYLAEPPVWVEHSISGAVHAAVWNGVYHYLASTGPAAEQTSFVAGVNYGLDVESAWLVPSSGVPGGQGRCHLADLSVLGELVQHHYLRVRLSYNYEPTVVDDRIFYTVAAANPDRNPAQAPYPGGPLQFHVRPSRPHDLESVKVRITAHGTPTQAVLDVIGFLGGDLSGNVELTSPSSHWNAQLTAAACMPGELGNVVGIAIGFRVASTASIDVRPHLYYDAATDTWSELRNCIGVRVAGNITTAPVTIAQLEAAINAGGVLATVTTPHATPSAIISTTHGAMTNVTVSAINDGGVGGFHGGAFAAPTDATLKLTALDLEVGIKRGLHNRLAASQKV